MKKFLFTFLAIFIAVFTFNPVYATDYTIGDDKTTSNNNFLPFSIGPGFNDSFTQQLYLASELTAKGASAGNITALTFKYVGATTSTLSNATRSTVEVWIREVSISSFSSSYGYGPSNTDKSAGTKYFEGSVELPITANATYKITLGEAFSWDGTSNIIITINDKTNNQTSGYARNHLVFAATNRGLYAAANNAAHDASDAYNISVTKISYVPVITFTFDDEIPAPTGLSADDEYITTSSARLSWNAVDDATSYNVRWGTTSGSLSESEEGVTNTYLDINELEDGTTYYFQVQTVTAGGTSAWADEVSFETLGITHEHNGITFSKWNSTTSMPTSGNYYLANDVELGAYTSLTGNLNLCLNGHEINTDIYNIVVPEDIKLAIYDYEGGGQIYGNYAGNNGLYYGLISVAGELVLSEGTVRNQNSGAMSYAIYNNGTFKLSGAPTITGNTAAIHLNIYKYITIESGKPLTNSTPYTVNSSGQVITSGWANMSGANPANFFTSAKSGYPAVVLKDGEANLVSGISLSDSEDNSEIIDKGENQNTSIAVTMTRSFTSDSYNTVCLPFKLTNEQLEYVFGSGYDLEEFTSSSLSGDELYLTFSRVDELKAGKPYLIKPSINVVNPTFNGVIIPLGLSVTPAAVVTPLIDFQGVYSPTNVGSGKNILFVGANNELFWNNNESGELKGFRAFFTAKGAAAKAVRARIVQHDNAATGIEDVQSPASNAQGSKILRDGQLYIMHNGTLYNVQGQRAN